ncbi:MAG: hypothetical protein K6T85_07955, partial [Gorillibacterium sp.]|nr:hypothetical protein [Gorillibacterium sp.]
VQAVLAGYGSRHKLTKVETLLLPELTKLRRLDVFLHFWNRYQAGLDPVDILQDQILRSTRTCQYINEHQTTLASAILSLVI